MKRFYTIIAALALAAAASAQSRQGTFSVIPRLGVTLSNISKEMQPVLDAPSYVSVPSKGKTKSGVLAGADMQYQITPIVAVSLGAFYTQLGCKYDDTDLTEAEVGTHRVYKNTRSNLHYISVPLLGHFYVAKGLAVNAGVQASWLVDNSVQADITNVTIDKNGSYTYTTQVEEMDVENTYAKKFELAIPVGLSYEYMNVVLDVRYHLGLSKVYDSPLDNGNKNHGLVVSAGYKFDL